jgi:hypothetical protein
MSRHRTALAFLFVPLISPVIGLVAYGVHTGAFPSFAVVRRLFLFFGVFAYILTAVFGLPAFLLLRGTFLGGKPLALVWGGLIGFITSLILLAIAPGFFISNPIEGYITYSLTGALSGLLFWMIATGGKAIQKSSASAAEMNGRGDR